MKHSLQGILPATVSPCDDNDRFLPDKFAELVVWLYTRGVHGLYVCGGTGDGYKMRLEERKKAAELATELSAGKGLTIVHGFNRHVFLISDSGESDFLRLSHNLFGMRTCFIIS